MIINEPSGTSDSVAFYFFARLYGYESSCIIELIMLKSWNLLIIALYVKYET